MSRMFVKQLSVIQKRQGTKKQLTQAAFTRTLKTAPSVSTSKNTGSAMNTQYSDFCNASCDAVLVFFCCCTIYPAILGSYLRQYAIWMEAASK